MHRRSGIGSIAFAAALCVVTSGARGADDLKYPDLRSQWVRLGGGHFDPTLGRSGLSKPPYTDEYRAIAEADQAKAGGEQPTAKCIPPGIPRGMLVIEPMEIIVTPEITYVELSYFSELRRIYTDGRDWPQSIQPSFTGYSIGKWEDVDGDGRMDVLTIETRGPFRGPRVFEGGLPLHRDNQTIVKERIYLDKDNPDILYDEITTIDHALSQPWTVKRSYKRERASNWIEFVCNEDNHYVTIGDETYFLSSDRHLMPMRKDQPPPDLRNFNDAAK